MVFFMVLLAFMGVRSYMNLGQSEDPDFTFKLMVVKAYLPGATLEETTRQLTDRLEKKLQEAQELDYVKSYTKPGETTIFVRLLTGADRARVPDTWYQVRKKIGDIRHELPAETVGPFFNDEFGDTYGLIYAFTSQGFSHIELKDVLESVRSELLTLPDVAKVDMIGAQPERIYVEFSPRRLAGLGISREQIAAAIQARNQLVPSGTLDNGREVISIETDGRFLAPEDIARIEIVSSDGTLRLGDIASVRRTTADPAEELFRYNGKDAVALGIVMREGGNMVDLGRQVRGRMTELAPDIPAGIAVHLAADQPDVVTREIRGFTRALAEAVAIVLALSFITLGARAGTVVAFSIPFVLALVFVAMDLLGIDLHRISLGSLVIALGLLVDDAMITVESMVSRLEHGWPIERSATFAYESTAIPMLTGTIVTVIGFIPVGLSRSEAGEYCFAIFAVVALALMFSWFVAVLCAPLIGVSVLRSGMHSRRSPFGPLKNWFCRALAWVMRHPWISTAATLAAFAGSVALLPLIPQHFFPPSARPELLVDISLRDSASISQTARTVGRLEKVLAADEDVKFWSSYIGRGAVRFYMPLDEQLPNPQFAQLVIIAKDLPARDRLQRRLQGLLENEYPEAASRVSTLEMGPPAGWPVSYRVSARDPRQAEKAARQVAALMAGTAGLTNINFNWTDTGRRLQVRVRQHDAERVGLTSAQIAQVLYSTYTGVRVTQVRQGIHLVDVVMRADPEGRSDVDSIGTLDIPLPKGGSVPLKTVADIGYTQDYPLIWRRNRIPTVTVQADVAPGFVPEMISMSLREPLDKLGKSLAAGIRIEEGGIIEESGKAQGATFATMPLMIVLMLVTLMLQLQSFRLLVLVLYVAPLGLIGVASALLASGQYLGYVALLGIVSLIGMIVRNAVILVHQAELEIEKGHDRWTALENAARIRARPIMLTAVAAILGMVPIAPTLFWGPMAYSIMGGLTAATILTLFALPAAYVLVYRLRPPA